MNWIVDDAEWRASAHKEAGLSYDKSRLKELLREFSTAITEGAVGPEERIYSLAEYGRLLEIGMEIGKILHAKENIEFVVPKKLPKFSTLDLVVQGLEKIVGQYKAGKCFQISNALIKSLVSIGTALGNR